MKLYNLELPEPIPANTSQAIRIARKIHQNLIDGPPRNTEAQRWDQYWIKIYDVVLEQLRRNQRKERG